MWDFINKHAKGVLAVMGILSVACGTVAAIVTRNNDLDNIAHKNVAQDHRIDKISDDLSDDHDKAETLRNNITRIETDVKWIREKLSAD